MKSIVKIFIVLPLLVLLTSCSNGNWDEINAVGLRDNNTNYNELLFLNSNEGLLAGSFYKNGSNSLVASEAIISKTSDSGHSWREYNLGAGEIDEIHFVDQTLVALKRVHTEESFNNLKSSILVSNNFGNSWETAYESKLPTYIRAIFPITRNHWVAIFENQNDRSINYIYKTKNTGETWQKAAETDYSIGLSSVTYSNDKLYYGVMKSKAEYSVTCIDLSNGIKQVIDLPSGFRLDLLSTFNVSEIWGCGLKNNQYTFYQIDNSGIIKEIKNTKQAEGSFIHSFHVEGKSIYAVGSSKSSILGVSKAMHLSRDSGLTWESEAIPSGIFAKHFAYINNKQVLAYTLFGTFRSKNLLTKQ